MKTKPIHWQKQGLVITPRSEVWWMSTFAGLAFVEQRGERYRFYIVGRDNKNISRIGIVETTRELPCRVLHVSTEPVLDIGRMGCFDENGVADPYLVRDGVITRMYYCGWAPSGEGRFRIELGLALSHDGGESFKKVSEAPIPFRDNVDPISYGGVCVRHENGLWRMWYSTYRDFRMHNNIPRHYHYIRYAESIDGETWKKRTDPVIDFSGPEEYAIAKPSILFENGMYRMWFAHRGDTYRIGYAESVDGLDWARQDDLSGIDVSIEGWDSEMIEYPQVLAEPSYYVMFYNGNGYGRSGTGLAVAPRNVGDLTK